MSQDIWNTTHFTGDVAAVSGPGLLKAVAASSGDVVIRDGSDATGTPIWEQPADSSSGEITVPFRTGLFVDAGAGVTGGAVAWIASA